LIMVITQFLEELLFLIITITDVSKQDVAHLMRGVRMLRAARVLRVVHIMRYVQELRLLISCLIHSMRAFLWTVVLLILMISVFGLGLCQVALFYSIDADQEDPNIKMLRHFFGTLPMAVLSLFGGLTSGVSWMEMVEPLMTVVHPYMGLLFFVYIAFTLLAVMNVVTAAFVQQAIDRSVNVKELQRVAQAKRLFMQLDSNQSSTITYSDLEDKMGEQITLDFFKSIDVAPSEAEYLFDMLDSDGTGEINFDEFMGGCLGLQGPAKSIDLVMAVRELKAFRLEGKKCEMSPRL